MAGRRGAQALGAAGFPVSSTDASVLASTLPQDRQSSEPLEGSRIRALSPHAGHGSSSALSNQS